MGQKVIEETVLELEEISVTLPEKVGILGGTFNPPHIGHTLIAEQVRDQLNLDMILFMPTAVPPHQQEKETISSDLRLTMTQLATGSNPNFQIESYEILRSGKNYTYETMQVLTELYPETDFYFIIGADMVEDLPNWYQIDELVQLIQFVAVQRPGYTLESDYPLIIVDTPEIAISSSQIRQMIADGRSVRYLVDDEVRYFIQEKGLYKRDEE